MFSTIVSAYRKVGFVLLAIALVAPTTMAGAPAAEDAVYTVGYRGDAPEIGDNLAGGTVIAVNDKARFATIQTQDRHGFAVRAANSPNFDYVEEDRVDAAKAFMTPNDPKFSDQWGWGPTPGVNAEAAWDVTTGSNSVIVAVLDTGIDANHPDFNNLLPGYDFVNNDGTPEDDCGHGTHVAGTVGATTNNGQGVAGAAQVSILPVKVMKNYSGSCSGPWSAVANGITYAVDQGADIITMSLGMENTWSSTVNAAMQYATDNDVLILAAAGNSGCGSCVAYPARNPMAMAVGALDWNGNVVSFSNKGNELEISAPGLAIWSTTPGGNYGSKSGTSMATPHVAGVAALVLSAQDMSAAQLRQHLKDTAYDLGKPATAQGAGAVDAAAAVTTLPSPTPEPEPEPQPEPQPEPEPEPQPEPEPEPQPNPEPSNQPPVASFTADCTGTTCTFDGTGSSDPDGTIASYAWDLGDGAAPKRATGTYTYGAATTYTVSLTVTDNQGATHTATQTIDLSEPRNEPEPIHVAAMTHQQNRRWSDITVTIEDASGAPVQGATVEVEMCGTSCSTQSATTDANGIAQLSWKLRARGSYTATVTSLTGDAFWDTAADTTNSITWNI